MVRSHDKTICSVVLGCLLMALLVFYLPTYIAQDKSDDNQELLAILKKTIGKSDSFEENSMHKFGLYPNLNSSSVISKMKKYAWTYCGGFTERQQEQVYPQRLF